MFWYGNPLISEGSGRIKTDSINEKRIETVLQRFEQWSKQKGLYSNFKFTVTKQQLQKSMVALPLAGFTFGILASYTFVHPNSKYIGKCFTLFTTYLGFYVYQHYQQAYNVSRRFGNFYNYPVEIQRMLDNNDSRYAFKWLKEDYINIPGPADGKAAQAASAEEDQE